MYRPPGVTRWTETIFFPFFPQLSPFTFYFYFDYIWVGSVVTGLHQRGSERERLYREFADTFELRPFGRADPRPLALFFFFSYFYYFVPTSAVVVCVCVCVCAVLHMCACCVRGCNAYGL
jgi:hypothetical protein